MTATPWAVEQLAAAVDRIQRHVPPVVESGDLADALVQLGQLQRIAGELADVLAYAELALLQRGATSEALPDGTVVKREAGSVNRKWRGSRDVIKAIAPDLLGQLGLPGWALVDRLEAALPASVQWKLAGVRPYADPDELVESATRSRTRLKVTLPAPAAE